MIELFSGIGAQKEGTDLTELFDCEVIATADIEKDAMVSYAAIHNGLTNEMIKNFSDYPSEDEMREELIKRNIGFDFKKNTNPIARMKGEKLRKYYLAMSISNNLGDISKIENLPLADFWTYSFPCQDISVAGKQAGIVKGQTRSGLLYEVERLLEIAKNTDALPKYLLLENVKNLVGKQFKEQFDDWISRLDELGFNTYWAVVNAKDCGIAQNRERVFAVSIRKDIDTGLFEFMKPYDLGLRLRDFLEDEVEDKYFLSPEIQERLQITDETFTKSVVGTTKPDFRTIGQADLVYQKDGIMGTLLSRDYKQPKQILEDISPKRIGGLFDEKVFDEEDGKEKIIKHQAGSVWDKERLAPTIDTCQGGYRQPLLFHNEKKVRKLTPRESFRLMGFSDEAYDKAFAVGLSDTAGYKQAGNSIVTYCIKGIMEHLYKAQYDNTYICFDEKINNYSNNDETNKIIVVGNYMPSNHDASRIVDEEGIAPCVKENHGTVTGVLRRNFYSPQVD